MHAGEPNDPNAPLNILTSIEKLGADRIGHGVQAIKDMKVIEVLRDSKIPLELCPTSNVLTKAVEIADKHPFKRLYDLGVRTTLNSDDPGVMGITLMTEYNIVHNILGVTLNELEKCNQWAMEASFICKEKKAVVWPV